MPADWQLPPGVSRGLWEYFHDPAIARRYDDQLKTTSLLHFDQGFGTGRLAVTLAPRGYWTLAVDLSAPMLKIASEKAERAGVVVHRLQANLVDLACLDGESFEYAACLFSTIGMI